MSSRTIVFLKGVALSTVLVLLPLALWRFWYQAGTSAHMTATRSVIAMAALWWMYVVGRVVAECWSIRQSSGAVMVTTGTMWIATMIVSVLSWAWPASASAQSRYLVPSTSTPAATYVVQPGDTLWGIADIAYGDGDQWRRILAANQGGRDGTARIDDPSMLRPGWRLRLPTAHDDVTQPAASKSVSHEDHRERVLRWRRTNTPFGDQIRLRGPRLMRAKNTVPPHRDCGGCRDLVPSLWCWPPSATATSYRSLARK